MKSVTISRMTIPILILAFLGIFISCAGTQEKSEYFSAEELSEAIGFTVVYPRTLPASYHAQEFLLHDTITAQITYFRPSEKDHLYYRMSAGSLTLTDEEKGGERQTDLSMGSISVRVYGTTADAIRTASWSVGGYSYAIISDVSFTAQEILNIIAGIA